MAEDMGEKTEQPTTKRLSDARERGQVAKSSDLSAAVVMAGATLVLVVFGVEVLAGMGMVMRYVLSPDVLATDLAGGRIASDASLVFGHLVRMVAPVMLVMLVVGYVAQVSQVGLMFSLKVMQPNLGKLNVIKGMKKFFSIRSLVRGGLDVLKLAMIGAVVWAVIWSEWEEILALTTLEVMPALVVAAWMIVKVAIWVLLVLLLLGLADFAYQKWQHNEDLKMTRHEVKDERKASEGDTEAKGRRMKLARQMAMQRLAHDVPRADVVVTNPTHFSVALKYDGKTMDAPKVVAKGADYLALKIRYIATAHGITIVERPPLARAIYQDVAVGREIHPAHYEAVAEVLAYVYRLEGRAAEAEAVGV